MTRSMREALLIDSICPVEEAEGSVVDAPADDSGVEISMEKEGLDGALG